MSITVDLASDESDLDSLQKLIFQNSPKSERETALKFHEYVAGCIDNLTDEELEKIHELSNDYEFSITEVRKNMNYIKNNQSIDICVVQILRYIYLDGISKSEAESAQKTLIKNYEFYHATIEDVFLLD